MTLAAILLAFTGFALLAIAMRRHREQMLGNNAQLRGIAPARPLGWALLALSLVPCVTTYGWSMGLLWWLGVLTAGAVPLPLLLSYRPRFVPPLMIAAPFAALAALTLT